MVTVTIRLPARKSGAGAAIEWYDSADAAIALKPSDAHSLTATEVATLLAADGVQGFFLRERGESDRFAAHGRTLFDALLGGPLAARWAALQNQADDGEPVRVYLDIRDPELGQLPWELMADADGPIFLRPAPLVMRWRDLTAAAKPPADPWPIRVLVVVACASNEAEKIGADRELGAIRRYLRSVDHSFDLDVLDARRTSCTSETIRARLDTFNPHILHVIGHAITDRRGGVLKLWDVRTGATSDWPARDIRIVLQQKSRDLRIVYLNACRTQKAQEQVDAISLADPFLKTGIPAVIAMQADVHKDAASFAAAAFYTHLSEGKAVDLAVEAGRILDKPELGVSTRNPFCAVLTVQRDPDTILRFRHVVDDATRRDLIEECAILKPVRSLFVNQLTHRRDLVTTFFTGPDGRKRSAAILRGTQDAGKSWLAKWLLSVYAFRNCGVRYVEARHCPDWLSLMREVLSGRKAGNYVHQPLPQPAQDFFYRVLDHVARDQSVPAGDPPTGYPDPGVTLSQAIEKDNDAVAKIMAAFLGALKIAAGDRDFLLVADHWHPAGDHGTAAVTVTDLKTHLWDRIAEDHHSRVKVVLVLPPNAGGQSGSDPDYPTAHWKHVTLSEIPAEEAPPLVAELYALRFPEGEPTETEKRMLSASVNSPSLPKTLDDFCKTVKSLFGERR